MKIGIPVAYFHPGTTAEYVQTALSELGHESVLLNSNDFYLTLKNQSFDLFFCVDSGEALNFSHQQIANLPLNNVAFWNIDYRHNKESKMRHPPDKQNIIALHEKGGFIFQAQYEDYKECLELGLTRVTWLPLAADPKVWSNTPILPKDFHISFVGNIWDNSRIQALKIISQNKEIKFGFLGHGKIWKENAAAFLRRSLIGFNISSFFGQEVAYDINMRVFETLSCGIPLFTNKVPSLELLFSLPSTFIRTYNSFDTLIFELKKALNDKEFLQSGEQAREYIIKNATYIIRMRQALETLRAAKTIC